MKMSVATEGMDEASVYSLSEDFLRTADDFSAMQQEHRTALLAGNCKDFLFWRQSREQAFRGLVRILERVVACGQDDKRCALSAREIMKKLLAEEDVLQELIVARQLKLQDQLQAMRKGKEALQGYSTNKGQVPRPRYLSSRM